MYFIKPVEELRFTDDFMFSYVMRNKDICREVIRRLLKIEAREIKYPEAQKTIAPIYSGKGIRLDVYTETPDEVVDIEMQSGSYIAISQRMRYYQSILDSDSLLKGSSYAMLKKSYVVFLCLDDPLGHGLPIYTFESFCRENKDIQLEDCSQKIIFNAAAWEKCGDIEIRAFLEYLKRSEATDKFLRRLDMTVDKIKEVQEFVNSYLAYNLHEYDVQERGRIEGAAMQKAKDERLINQQAEEIARLKALLAEKNTHP